MENGWSFTSYKLERISIWIIQTKNFYFAHNYANLLNCSEEFKILVLNNEIIVIKGEGNKGIPVPFHVTSYFNLNDWRTTKFLGKIFKCYPNFSNH